MTRSLLGVSALLAFAFPVQAQAKDDPLPPDAVARLGEVRYPNVGSVLSIAFSPDGKTLLAGAWDGSIRLWDVASGKEIRQYPGHSGWVRSVAFAPDGKTFASGGKDKIIRIWETDTGKVVRRLEGHRNWIQYLAFSHNGKLLGSRSTGLMIRLWDASRGEESLKLNLQPHTPSDKASFAFSPKGELFAYPSSFGSLVLLDLANSKDVWRITGTRQWYGNLTFSPDGAVLAGVGWGSFHLWDTTTGRELRPLALAKTGGSVSGSVFSPDGRSLATADPDHSLRMWELASRKTRCLFRSPDCYPSVLAFSPDGRTLAQGSDDITVLLWDVTGLQGTNRPKAISLADKQLQTLWADLASDDAAAAHQTIRTLVAGAKDSLPFLRKKLRPASPVADRAISLLVADLDSDEFQTREQATEKLEKLAELAEPALRRALREKPPLEKRQRVDRLLEKVDGERDNPSPERLRMLRALEALEYMDTPAARQTLEQLAHGAAAAEITKQAKAALQRLAKRTAYRP